MGPAEAVKHYSQAIAGAEHDEALFANRSAAYLAQQLYSEAIADAAKAVQLKEAWPKGHYRYPCVFPFVSPVQVPGTRQTCSSGHVSLHLPLRVLFFVIFMHAAGWE